MNSSGYNEKTDGVTKNRDRFIPDAGINQFSERLKEAMKKAGELNNLQLAQVTGMSEGVIRKYLRGESYPTLDRLVLIARACSCDVGWLATGEPKNSNERANSPSTALPEPKERLSHTDPIAEQFLFIISMVGDEKKEELLRLIYTKGVDSLLTLSNELNAVFIQLPEEEKARLLRLNDEIKKGALEDNQNNEMSRPTHKAG